MRGGCREPAEGLQSRRRGASIFFPHGALLLPLLLLFFLREVGAQRRRKAPVDDTYPRISCYTFKHVEEPGIVGAGKEFQRTILCPWGVQSCVVMAGTYAIRDHFLGMSKVYYDGGCGPAGKPIEQWEEEQVEEFGEQNFWPNATSGLPRNPTRFKCGGPVWGGGETPALSTWDPLTMPLIDINETFPTGSVCADTDQEAPGKEYLFDREYCKGYQLEADFYDPKQDAYWRLNFTRNLSAYPYDLANDPESTAYEPTLDLISIFECKTGGDAGGPPLMTSVCYDVSQIPDSFVDCGIDYQIELCFGDLCNAASRRFGGSWSGGGGVWGMIQRILLSFLVVGFSREISTR